MFLNHAKNSESFIYIFHESRADKDSFLLKRKAQFTSLCVLEEGVILLVLAVDQHLVMSSLI